MPEINPENIILPDSALTKEEIVDSIVNFNLADTLGSWIDAALDIGIRVLLALVIFYIGRWLIRIVMKGVTKILDRRIEPLGLRHFIRSIARAGLWIVLVIMVINILGFAAVSFAALLASLGVAIGMALSGQLQNFAGGAIILITHPFRIGDYIVYQDVEGTVQDIGIFHTSITTTDNTKIYLPNGNLSTNIIKNTSEMPNRRCQWKFLVDYDVPFERAKGILLTELLKDPRVLQDQGVLAVISDMTESNYTIMIRVWCTNDNMWDLFWDFNGKATELFAGEGFPRPYSKVELRNSTPYNKETKSDD
ncbi:transporter, small conductance mechanosensitive ion channel MscS family protein [Porphyromonas uenonis 60-3]|uniref:Transporter, small conductance mechanosensitive ion channel MscS family protein n=1 Tax=Porphyromonas uenonis 60-3 TaxID=596327 RepID=C2MBA8_9PORP|nr:mechanosensitive ion channel family protein [Porphyromonas uenonis]EEK17024.1 transporter, small conductance mechanosensitive ion channel MscS family protein [Porphyromonas uenonis 60-3]